MEAATAAGLFTPLRLRIPTIFLNRWPVPTGRPLVGLFFFAIASLLPL
jgi:hypothetical protein